MTLRELDLEELQWLHAQELTETFPPEELKPFAAMEKLCASGLYHPVGAYDRFIQIPRDPDHPLSPPESRSEQSDLPGLERKEDNL